MLSEVKVMLHCSNCLSPMGHVSDQEAIAVMSLEPGGALCFNCEPVAASHRSEFFKGLVPGEIVDLGDSRFCVTSDGNQIVEVGFVPAHERTRTRGLSSYTYLNKKPEKSVVLRDGLEVKQCKNCDGLGVDHKTDRQEDCEECTGWGSVASAIFIPAWMVSGGENNV